MFIDTVELIAQIGRALTRPQEQQAASLEAEVLQVLVDQLGYKRSEARRLVTRALGVNSGIDTAEALLDEIFRLPPGE